MRAVIYKVFLIIIFGLLSVQILDIISIFGEKPDILLILTLYFAQRKGVMEGQVIGFFSGLMEDFFSIQLFGIHCFVKMIIGHITGFIHENFVIDNAWVQVLLGLSAVFVQGLLFILAKAIFDQIDVIYYVKTSLWIKMLYTAALTPLIFFLLNFLEKHFGES